MNVCVRACVCACMRVFLGQRYFDFLSEIKILKSLGVVFIFWRVNDDFITVQGILPSILYIIDT